MSEPFLAEIRIVAFNFAPKGWAICNGQLLSISQNQALFALIGNTFGGDGRVNFALPDLRGRAAVHPGTDITYGQRGGAEQVTLGVEHLPSHVHGCATSDQATAVSPISNVLASKPRRGVNVFVPAASVPSANRVALASDLEVGGDQPHENRQPFLVMNFVIALQGIFPPQN